MDYFSDISRIKKFHNIGCINSTKIVSYEIHWLLRRKPLQVILCDSDSTVFVNEQFIQLFIFKYLKAKFNDIDYERIKPFAELIFYNLCYRPIDAQTIELSLVAFEAGIEMLKSGNR